MAPFQDVQMLVSELMEELELERAKYLSQIRTLQAEIDALGNRKRKKKGFGHKSSAADEDFQEKLSELLHRIGDIHDDLKVRYWLALEQLAEQRRGWNQLNRRIRQLESKSPGFRGGQSSRSGLRSGQARSADYNQFEGDGISRLQPGGQDEARQRFSPPQVRTRVRQSPDLTEIEDIPELSRVSLASDGDEYQRRSRNVSRTTDSEKRNENKRECKERCVHSTIHDGTSAVSRIPSKAGSFLNETSPVSRIPSKAGTFLDETSATSRMPCRTSTNLSGPSAVSKLPSRTSILNGTSTVTKIPSRSALKVSKKASPPAYEYKSIANYEELPKDVKLVMEAERERHRLEIRALLVEIGEKDDHIETLRTQIKVKDAQISQLASIVYVGQKLQVRK